MIKSVEQFDAAISPPNDTPEHRQAWNGYVNYLNKRGIAGSPKLDVNNLGANLLNNYIKENPSTPLTPDSHIHAQNDMSNLNPNETSVVDGLHSSATKTKFSDIGDPTKGVPVNQDASAKFANWTGSQDTKVAAKDLLDRGLNGADQLYFENQKTGTADDITKKNQSDWKIAAAQKILQKAYQKGIKDPTTFLAPENRDYLLSGLSPDIKAAVNDPTFNRIHGNFWEILGNSILPQQWAKEEANKNAVAQK